MMYLVLAIKSTTDIDNTSQLSAWVNVETHNDALAILSEELSIRGWVVTDVLESMVTDETDYFAPCKSLDAFNEASKGLLALRFTS